MEENALPLCLCDHLRVLSGYSKQGLADSALQYRPSNKYNGRLLAQALKVVES